MASSPIMKISHDIKLLDVLRDSGTKISFAGATYHFLPFWFKVSGGAGSDGIDKIELCLLENLPEDVKSHIYSLTPYINGDDIIAVELPKEI